MCIRLCVHIKSFVVWRDLRRGAAAAPPVRSSLDIYRECIVVYLYMHLYVYIYMRLYV